MTDPDSELREAAQRIAAAVNGDEAHRPFLVSKGRHHWPQLWRGIDQLLAALDRHEADRDDLPPTDAVADVLAGQAQRIRAAAQPPNPTSPQ